MTETPTLAGAPARPDTGSKGPADGRGPCVHDLVTEHARQHPDQVAVVSGDVELTYAELDRRANRLAHHLVALGVRTETSVGVMLGRSLDFVIAALAVIKAGGVYVPLDAEYPASRLAVMLADAVPPVVLTRRDVVGDPPPHGGTVVHLDDLETTLAALPDDPPDVPVDLDNAIYVMYTSGSTGTPKGVVITHRGIVRLAKYGRYARLGPDEVILQISSVSFDASTAEIWGALVNGARLVIGPPTTPSLIELGRLLRRHGVTTLWLTAGLFHVMVDERLADLSGVRQLLAGGDALSVAHVVKVLRTLPECRLINGYGPTENTTFTTCHPLPPDWQPGASVPIGRPIGRTYVRILGQHLELLPVGAAGELYAGGEGLARGYLNNAALTAERFVPDPHAVKPGARLYATGDRARHLPDGTIEFLGRMDNQVKIRGFRVEPAEIEEALRAHPSVRDVVVVPHGDSAETRGLVAYPVFASAAAATADETLAEVRTWLRERLPEHLVPGLWVPLDAFPLTPHGKVDRAALPPPASRRSPAAEAAAEPEGEDERTIAGIWAEVLRVDHVGRHDDFFELGGHSLLATKLVSRLRQALGVELPLSAVFENPTVAELAELIRRST